MSQATHRVGGPVVARATSHSGVTHFRNPEDMAFADQARMHLWRNRPPHNFFGSHLVTTSQAAPPGFEAIDKVLTQVARSKVDELRAVGELSESSDSETETAGRRNSKNKIDRQVNETKKEIYDRFNDDLFDYSATALVILDDTVQQGSYLESEVGEIYKKLSEKYPLQCQADNSKPKFHLMRDHGDVTFIEDDKKLKRSIDEQGAYYQESRPAWNDLTPGEIYQDVTKGTPTALSGVTNYATGLLVSYPGADAKIAGGFEDSKDENYNSQEVNKATAEKPFDEVAAQYGHAMATFYSKKYNEDVYYMNSIRAYINTPPEDLSGAAPAGYKMRPIVPIPYCMHSNPEIGKKFIADHVNANLRFFATTKDMGLGAYSFEKEVMLKAIGTVFDLDHPFEHMPPA